LVYKSRGSPFDPFTCARAVRATPTATLSRTEEGSRSTRRSKQRQGQRHEEQKGEVDAPGKALAGGTSAAPARALPGRLAQRQQSAPPLSPRFSNTTDRIGTKAREAPPWWHADLCEDHNYTRPEDDDPWRDPCQGNPRDPPARFLPGTTTTPRRDPCRGPGKALAENISGATVRPASAKTPPPSPYSC
jgi:hypothetical protein